MILLSRKGRKSVANGVLAISILNFVAFIHLKGWLGRDGKVRRLGKFTIV